MKSTKTGLYWLGATTRKTISLPSSFVSICVLCISLISQILLAAHVDDLIFSTPPDQIVDPDPIIIWQINTVPGELDPIEFSVHTVLDEQCDQAFPAEGGSFREVEVRGRKGLLVSGRQPEKTAEDGTKRPGRWQNS